MVRFHSMQQVTLKFYSMKVKVFEEYYTNVLEEKVNEFLLTISNEQIKHIKMSSGGKGHTAIAIFYTEK